jgi:hypothetical protein
MSDIDPEQELLQDLALQIRQSIDAKIIEDLKRMEDPLKDLKKLIKKAKRNVRRSTNKAKSAKTYI